MATDPTSKKHHGRPFQPGVSGNPAGRPRGSRNAALAALDAIGSEAAEAVLRSVVQAAKNGDVKAAEILLRRLWPERKGGRPVALPGLPPLTSAADLPAALARVAGAVADGTLTADEGQAVAAIVEAQRRAVETVELEARITKLEEKGKENEGN